MTTPVAEPTWADRIGTPVIELLGLARTYPGSPRFWHCGRPTWSSRRATTSR